MFSRFIASGSRGVGRGGLVPCFKALSEVPPWTRAGNGKLGAALIVTGTDNIRLSTPFAFYSLLYFQLAEAVCVLLLL